MGMDIYGLDPKLVSKEPQRPDWEKATKEEKDSYFVAKSAWEEENPGYYFRANIWSWRPIHVICETAIFITELPFDTKGWGDNSGNGLKTQEECDLLANAIDVFLTLNEANAKEDTDNIYICYGLWVHGNGSFIEKEKCGELDAEYPFGTILYNGVVNKDGDVVFPAWGTTIEHVREFVNFLRHCGGFQIC